MTTYILILTILRYQAVSVESVPGFTSLEACEMAGNAWLRSLQAAGGSKYFNLRAICVPTMSR